MPNNRRIAYIDLDKMEVKKDILSEEITRFFMGGRGINMYLLYSNVSPRVKSLDSDNCLIIGTGLLSGMPVPSSARCSISGKSPETELLGDSNIGGYFAAELRKAGFDHLVIRGKAGRHILVIIEDGEIRFEDADFVWGKDTIETTEMIKNRYGSACQALCIGPAGEKLVRFACVRHGWKSAAGRTGMGCLMGAKNIKAIIARGKARLPIKYPDRLRNYTAELNDRINRSRMKEILHENGTPFLFDLHNKQGIVRTYNGQVNLFEKGRNLRSANLKRKYYKDKRGCFSCTIKCRHRYEIKRETGDSIYGEGPEYGTLGAFGPICGIENLEAILVINDLLNRYGLDSNSTGNIIAWAIELFKLGIINENDTDGLKLDWGDEETIIKLISQISRREGFGDILANGAYIASKKIGKESEKYLTWVKFLPQSDSADVRVHKGFALGVATSTRGADHLRSRPTLEALNLSEEQLKEIFGGVVSSDPSSYLGKARMVWWTESYYALADALGICKFALMFNSIDNLGFEELRKLIYYSVGIELSPEELFKIGERIITLERMFLAREGISRKDDTLPLRYFEPMPLGPHKGESIDKRAFSIMLNEYYQLHGWDINTGIPTEQNLKRLQLDKLDIKFP